MGPPAPQWATRLGRPPLGFHSQPGEYFLPQSAAILRVLNPAQNKVFVYRAVILKRRYAGDLFDEVVQ